MKDMVNLKIALACEYAGVHFRGASTFESCKDIFGTDTHLAVDSRVLSGIEELVKAADLLGYTFTKKPMDYVNLHSFPLSGIEASQ